MSHVNLKIAGSNSVDVILSLLTQKFNDNLTISFPRGLLLKFCTRKLVSVFLKKKLLSCDLELNNKRK